MRPEMNINTQEICPSCSGTGKISSTLILEDEIEKNLNDLITHKHKGLKLFVHPIMYAYLTKGMFWNSKIAKWNKKFGQKTKVEANSTFHLTEYKFYDVNDEEIKM